MRKSDQETGCIFALNRDTYHFVGRETRQQMDIDNFKSFALVSYTYRKVILQAQLAVNRFISRCFTFK